MGAQAHLPATAALHRLAMASLNDMTIDDRTAVTLAGWWVLADGQSPTFEQLAYRGTATVEGVLADIEKTQMLSQSPELQMLKRWAEDKLAK